MSCYEWERGTIKIPSADWAKTKAHVRDAMNRRQSALFEAAEKTHKDLGALLPELKEQLEAGSIGKWDFDKKISDVARKHMQAMMGAQRMVVSLFDEYDENEVIDKIIVTRDPKTRAEIAPRLKKPLKKDFPNAGNNVNAFTASGCHVLFDNVARTAQWEVFDNNHAVDRARATVLGKSFFEAMKKITWVRGSGGEIYGNDEYNEYEGRNHSGGGGSMTKQVFSAEQQKRDKEAAAAARRSYGSYGGYGGYGYRR